MIFFSLVGRTLASIVNAKSVLIVHNANLKLNSDFTLTAVTKQDVLQHVKSLTCCK